MTSAYHATHADLNFISRKRHDVCKNIRVFCKKVFSIDTFCYDSAYFIVFPSGTEFLGVFPLLSHYGRKLHFYFLFVSSTFSLLCILVNRTVYSRFIVQKRRLTACNGRTSGKQHLLI